MRDLISKRHEGDGWLVFYELASRPGFQAKRYADAFALGVWASTKYEGHLYEEKCSREDVKRELRDPSKAEGLGRYATYWWLVISDEKIIDGLVVPGAWGILTPTSRGGSRMLRVVRKAPRLTPRPMDPLFVIAMVRNAMKAWVPRAEHEKLREEMHQLAVKRSTADLDESIAADRRELDRLKARIAEFKAASGIDLLDSDYHYSAKPIGNAVKLALEHRHELGTTLDSRADVLERVAETQERAARSSRQAAEAVRAIAGADRSEQLPLFDVVATE